MRRRDFRIWAFVLAAGLAIPLGVLAIRGTLALATLQEGRVGGRFTKCGVAVFRATTLMWYVDSDLDGDTDCRFGPWGLPGGIPVSGDFDRDKGDLIVDEVALFHPVNGRWYYCLSPCVGDCGGSVLMIGPWNPLGDGAIGFPFAGDFDHDGKNDDVGLFYSMLGKWCIDLDHNGTIDIMPRKSWGLEGDLPVVGDFDRDLHIDDLAVFRPSNQMWYFDLNLDTVTDIRHRWGHPLGGFPVAGDFDADGFFDDVGLFEPNYKWWFLDYDHDGYTDRDYGPWGTEHDWPVALYYFRR